MRSIKHKYRLDVELHEIQCSPHDILFDRVGRGLVLSYNLQLRLGYVVEPPSCLINGHSKWSAVLLVVVRRESGNWGDIALPNHLPQPGDPHFPRVRISLRRSAFDAEHASDWSQGSHLFGAAVRQCGSVIGNCQVASKVRSP